MIIDRRGFFLGGSATTAASLLPSHCRANTAHAIRRRAPKIPRWRGFNLTELLQGERPREFQESDFHWMASYGFNFARLPCSYLAWTSNKSWEAIDDAKLQPLDRAIELGRQYDIHINLCLHRIPGYCVNDRESEPYQLFEGPPDSMQLALDAAVYHWRYLTRRYRHVPNQKLSFDLLNEPPVMADQTRYVEIVKTLITSIRSISPERLIFADGTDLGQTPVMDLASENIVQSTRGYLPKMVSHYKAKWVSANEFESFAVPTWPMTDRYGVVWNREKLRHECILKWEPLMKRGGSVHVGEWGCYNETPHAACLAWITDLLYLWKEAGWGWAMWNLRGPFGVLDNGRTDIALEYRGGHWVDRKMLDLLVTG